MQEIMQYTTYGIALIGGLAFLVAIIVQVLKELPKLKKIPTVRTESPQDLKQMNLKYLQEPETEKYSARI